MVRSDITTEPDPPIEGQTVVISVPHSGPWFIARDGSGDVVECTANDRGEIELPAPPGRGGETFTVTDYRDPATDGNFSIQSQERN